MNNKKKKSLYLSEEIINTLTKSINEYTLPTRSTLGPDGLLVSILDNNGIRYTKDGVTVIRNMVASDPITTMFIKSIQEASNNVNDLVGDGTTTIVVLINKIIPMALKKIMAGIHRSELVQGIEKAGQVILDMINEVTIPSNEKLLSNIAMMATNHDKELADIISEAINKTDATYGLISVEDGNRTVTELEITHGTKLSGGYISPYFVSMTGLGGTITFNDALVVIFNSTISADDQEFVIQCLSECEYTKGMSTKASPIVIICSDIDKVLLNTILINFYREVVKAVVVKYAGSPESLKDIALITGATILTSSNEYNQNIYDKKIFGRCKHVKIDAQQSYFYNTANEDELRSEISLLTEQINKEGQSTYQIDQIKERISRLVGKAAIIKVGACTKSELSEKKDRAVDAVSAVKSAVKGVVIGGGMVLLKIHKQLSLATAKKSYFSISEMEGASVLIDSLVAPIEQLLENATLDKHVIIQALLSSKNPNYCYDVKRKTYCDAIEAGILDSAEALKMIIKTAVSTCKLMVGTSALINKSMNLDNGNSNNSSLEE